MPTPNLTSPNIGNYYVGRGYLSMKLQGESVFTDMGNCKLYLRRSLLLLYNEFCD